MENPQDTAAGSGPTITPEEAVIAADLEAHLTELRASVDAQLDSHAIRTLRRYDESTADEISRRYDAGESAPVIAADLGIPRSTVYYQLRRRGVERRPSAVTWKHPAPSPRSCEICGEEFTPTGYSVSRGWGRFCSLACKGVAERVAEPEPRACRYKHCGKVFTPWPSEAVRPGRGQFCSHACRQLHFWRDEPERVAAFLRSVEERYATSEGRAHLIKASARGLQKRHGSTKAFGRLASLLAAEKGKRVGRPSEAAAFAELILDLDAQGWSQQAIAEGTGLSRYTVGRFLRTHRTLV